MKRYINPEYYISIRPYFHEVTVVNENRIQFACGFSSLPSLRENRNELC